MSQERVRGKVNRVKGKVEEELGQALGDSSTEWSGKVDQVKGTLQEKVAEVKQDTRRFADGGRVR
jgi:uncharacterized protein YjbJ (UPF0337 family)